MRTRVLIGVLGVWALAPGCGSATEPRPAAPAALRIEKLGGAVARIGSLHGRPLLGTRLRATVCARFAEATYPDVIAVTHFVLAGKPNRWWPVRDVIDHPRWLVPLGEAWNGRPCGPLYLEDPVPDEYYGGVERLGNPLSCYGVELTIRAGGRRASRRAVIQCGGFHAG
jgi:hypothetical protein